MKLLSAILLAFVITLSAQARDYTVRRLPGPRSFVAEVSTNVAFNVHRRDVRTFVTRMEVDSVSSTAVQIAFGRDADGDGVLAVEETRLVLGFGPDRIFIENVAADETVERPVAEPDGSRRFFEMTVKTDSAFAPKSCAFTNETGVCFSDVSTACPNWVFNPEWNLFKVTRRGAVSSHELVQVKNDYNFMYIILR